MTHGYMYEFRYDWITRNVFNAYVLKETSELKVGRICCQLFRAISLVDGKEPIASESARVNS